MTLKVIVCFLVCWCAFANTKTTTTTEPTNFTSSERKFIFNIQNVINKLNAEFGRILVEQSEPEGNALFSPLNVYTTLAMIQLGATRTTRDELSVFLGLDPIDDYTLIEKHDKLSTIINETRLSQSVNVSTANMLFLRKDLEFKSSYLWRCKEYYGNDARLADFAGDDDNATDTVNNWICNETGNRLTKLFQSRVPSTTKLLYASTLHFSAPWANHFPEEATKIEKFNTGVKEVDVQMMNCKQKIPYTNNATLHFEAISLPYVSQEYSMIVLLPYVNRSLTTLLDALTVEQYAYLVQNISSTRTQVDCKIPRLKFNRSRSIKDHLTRLGVRKIFANDAELDNVDDGEEQIAVSDIVHGADIEINENGTTAAVVDFRSRATSVQKISPESVKFHVDRPFAFFIHHHHTGVTLFTGLIRNPAERADAASMAN